MARDLYGTRVLSATQARVVEYVAAGWKNKDIAGAIGTTELVIKNTNRIIFDKLGVSNRVEVALWWMAHHPGRDPLDGGKP